MENNNFENMPWNNFENYSTEPQVEEENIYEDNTNNNFEEIKQEFEISNENEIIELIQHITGKTETGLPASVIGYQTYALEDADSPEVNVPIYTTSKAHIEMYFDKMYPMFYDVDFIFPSADEPELKLMWGNLQRFKKNQINKSDKTWVFYINVLGTNDVTVQTSEQDILVTANIFNPILFYLTREMPSYRCQDNFNETDNEYYGGNIIKMLVPKEFVTFNITNKIDTLDLKGQVESEEMEMDFINNVELRNNNWNE